MPAFADGHPVKFKVMRDVDPTVGITDITTKLKNSFEPTLHSNIRSMYGERSLWIKIDSIKPKQILQLSPGLDEVTLYFRKVTSPEWVETLAGDQIDQSTKALQSTFTAFSIPGEIDQNAVYVRIVQSTALSIKVSSWSKAGFNEMQEKDENLKLFLFGFVLATIAYNMFVSVLIRDPVFMLNALTVASLLVLSLYVSGYGVSYFWRDLIGWSNWFFVSSVYCGIVFGGLFLWQFLRSKTETLSSGWPIVMWPTTATVIMIMSPWLAFWLTNLGMLISAASMLLCALVFVCKRAWTGDARARILIVPLIFAVIPGLILLTLERIFGIGTNRYTNNTLEITFCVEGLLFSLALAARVRIGEQAIRAANENILKLKFESTVKSVEAQDAERKRLAKELHDGVGQNFLSVVGSLKALATKEPRANVSKSLHGLVDVATGSLNELRRISKDMHPSSLEHLGLKRAIELLFEKLEATDQIETKLTLQFSGTNLTPKMELNVYRIFQECLSNISRHADATHCQASVLSDEGQLVAIIEDDGSGIGSNSTTHSGLGLTSIEERVHSLKGQYALSDSDNGGTKIKFSFPLASQITEEGPS